MSFFKYVIIDLVKFYEYELINRLFLKYLVIFMFVRESCFKSFKIKIISCKVIYLFYGFDIYNYLIYVLVV